MNLFCSSFKSNYFSDSMFLMMLGSFQCDRHSDRRVINIEYDSIVYGKLMS